MISLEYEANDQRLELATKLLDQKRFDEARHVLDQVTKDTERGRALALRGKLAALQGDCATAIRLYAQAEREGGCGCVPVEDRKLCDATTPQLSGQHPR